MSTHFFRNILLAITLSTGAFFLVCCSATSTMTASTPATSVTTITYQKDIRPIVSNYCTSCHGGDMPAAGFALTSYETVREKTEFGALLQRINNSNRPMPMSGLLPKEMRETFSLWAEQGYPKGGESEPTTLNYDSVPPAEIAVVDINEKGFDLLESMQGHWVGSMDIMTEHYDWFAFDYRAIGPSHVHGIFEGGTMGNLFTSFFVTEYQGKRTIMARNGGLLNGIYRTSYFVLDKVEYKNGQRYYRLVDAYGGADVMHMELTFSGDRLKFQSFTSSFATYPKPRRHMNFVATRMHSELAKEAADRYDFPRNKVDFDFSEGLPKPDWGAGNPQTSASYMWEEEGKSLEELAVLANDPYPLAYVPNVGSLKLSVAQTDTTKGQRYLVYLSRTPLTDPNGKLFQKNGYPDASRFNGVLSFPEIEKGFTEFTFTYLHPGTYYLTVVVDTNNDHYPSKGDITHSSIELDVFPKSEVVIAVDGIRTRI